MVCFDFLCNFCVKHFSFQQQFNRITNFYRSSSKVPVIIVRFQFNLNFLETFEKYSYIKLHENASSGSSVVPCEHTHTHTDTHTHTHTHTGMMKPIFEFCILRTRLIRVISSFCAYIPALASSQYTVLVRWKTFVF